MRRSTHISRSLAVTALLGAGLTACVMVPVDPLQVAGPLAMTMMACDEALMDQDQWLSEFLTSSPALAVDGETLTLGDDTTGITLSEN